MSSVGYNPEFWDFSNDCTNFVSQAMWAGGWPTSSGWWYADDDPNGNEDYPLDGWSSSWTVSTDFYSFVNNSGRGYFLNKNATSGNVDWADVVPGDVIFVDWDGQNPGNGYLNINHAMIVTSTSGVAQGNVYLGDILITQHTTNRKDYHLSNDTAQFPNARWWVMEPY
jgi:hypothetical protein